MALHIRHIRRHAFRCFRKGRDTHGEAIIARLATSSWKQNRGLDYADLAGLRISKGPFSTCCVNWHQDQTNTVDEHEVAKFSRIAETWWNTSGEFVALHTMNDLRIPLIRDALTKSQQLNENDSLSKRRPLTGLSILDVGCGGGILCEPLARLGAKVTGIDASYENIEVAKYHAKLDPLIAETVSYENIPVEDFVKNGKEETFDGVVASEIIEHVADHVGFISACCNLVKPGGSIFFTTINKTILARVLTIYAAENILGIVPKGAHDWEKFMPPEDIQFLLTQNQFNTRLVHGMFLNPCTMKWSWVADTKMNYALHATKPIL